MVSKCTGLELNCYMVLTLLEYSVACTFFPGSTLQLFPLNTILNAAVEALECAPAVISCFIIDNCILYVLYILISEHVCMYIPSFFE